MSYESKRDQRDEEIREMLTSMDRTWNAQNPRIRILIMQARLGSIEPPTNEDELTAICSCGWRGTFVDCHMEDYDNGQWARHAGRRGTHWNCPQCGAVVWRYYNVIN